MIYSCKSQHWEAETGRLQGSLSLSVSVFLPPYLFAVPVVCMCVYETVRTCEV